jgi:HK97 family phage major capsid protein
MAYPLADVDSPLWKLRAELEDRKREAKQRWFDFESYRKEHREKLAKGAPKSVVDRAQELHDAYEAVVGECLSAEARLMAEFDRSAFGKSRSPGVEFGRLTGIAEAFVKNLGGGSVDGLKALVSGGSPVPPFFDERIRQLPQRARFVRSLIPVVPVDSDTVNYVRQSVLTIAAAPVAAGAEKPTSTITIEKVSTPVQVIAHISEPIDRSILSDFDSLTEFLDAELRYGVLFAEDDQVLNGTGVSPELTGILTTAGILSQARGTDAHHEAIYKAITAVRNQDSPYEPDAIVLHPLDWQTIRLAKAADGTNLTAPIIEADPDRLWSKPVVTTRAIAQGTGLVGAFGVGAKLYDREEAIVRIAESGALGAAGVEIFSRNSVVMLAEERVALTVERPSAFAEVTGL